MTPSLTTLLAQADSAQSRLAAHLPLPHYTASSLREKLHLDWIYHSNALAGNSLTLREAKVVLEDITVGGKTIAEHLDVLRHRDAIYYIENRIAQNKPVNARAILDIHHVLETGSIPAQTNTTHFPGEEITNVLAQHIAPPTLHPIIDAARRHACFTHQLPFDGDTGRLARLLLNYDLARAGYGFPPAIILVDDKQHYDTALKQTAPAQLHQPSNACDDLAALIATATVRTLNVSLDLLHPGDRDHTGAIPPASSAP